MSCGLEPPHLFILNVLKSNRCISKSRGFNENKLKGLFIEKFDTQEYKFKRIIQRLLNEGYITKLDKKDTKYYISGLKIAFFALDHHGYKVPRR